MIAKVVINSTVKSLNKMFDYNIPNELSNDVKVGSRVLVPFGRGQKQEEGFVIEIQEFSDYKTKDIIKVQEGFSLNEEKIKLARLMSRKYFCNLSDSIRLMFPPGTTNRIITNRIKEKTMQFVYLKENIENINDKIQNKIIKSQKQIRVLEFLKENDGVGISDLKLFTDTTTSVIKTLEKNGYIELIEKQVERNPFINKNIQSTSKLKLTKEQQYAYDKVNESIENEMFIEFLLYGVTGSGKTEIYLQLIEKIVNMGKSAIVLVPEISLTPQMVDRFIARFGEEIIAVLHSKLSLGERYDQWNRIQNGISKIVIGARSAIFAPIENLGIIIIDEEHDNSYKSEMNPRYNAKEIAKYIASENNIPLLLGSATPDLNTFYKANIGKIEILKLTKRANDSNLPNVDIVDLRQELSKGNRSMISTKLYEKIEENIQEGHQTILFLNRRGFSTFVMCRDCGYTAKCNNCNISLTYHMKENKLKCHYCGYEQNNITICPECNSSKVKYFGTGTQKLEYEINQLFPKASTIRMDIDTVSRKNSHEEILNKFNRDNIDILIGTQMVVKGHHFPNVTLVGVIAADGSLNIGDYRANERTFQILTQVAGRAGREKIQGNVIVQTYNPDNFSIEYAKKQDYDLFYNTEINLRKQLKYPPFCDIIVIGISSQNEKEIIKASNFLYENIEKNNIKMMVYRPMPAPINKIKMRFRWRIIIKCHFNNSVIDVINNSLSQLYQKKFNDVRVVVDVNPNNML